MLNRYCVTCHNSKLKTAELDLQNLDPADVRPGAAIWEKVLRKVRTGAMPPAGRPRPDAAVADEFATYLETALDHAAAAHPNPGRTVAHRLNRNEYANAVRDLLALDVDAQPALPSDDSREGFDNIAEVLSVSPTLLERYLGTARRISQLAVGDPAPETLVQRYDIPDSRPQDDRMSKELPFGSVAGTAVRHHFLADGEYAITVRLRRSRGDSGGDIRGLLEPEEFDLRLDGARIKLFTVGGERKGRSGSQTAYGDPEQEAYERSADEGLEVRLPVTAGMHVIQVSFVKHAAAPEGVYPNTNGGQYYLEGDPTVESVTVSGPYRPTGPGKTPSRERIFVCRGDAAGGDEPCAEKILSTLARRAYRRPVTGADVRPLMNLYRSGKQDGGFEEGIRLALQSILMSPKFLYRIEADPASAAAGAASDAVHRISDLELASRLSFFLWSSIPDDELLDLAANGTLSDRAVLEHQVRRMLADQKSKAFVSNFAGQWLLLRNIAEMSPDPDEFPDFDDSLRDALRQETELFFESLVRDDRPVADMLTASYTFLNQRLAEHYGVPNVFGSQFRRVTLTDQNRQGLLGQGSLLAMTSYSNRTSVVLRGKWILENILGTPPPPPANVPGLKDRNEAGKILSVRQQMEQHRANAVCASCHARMDPLGFALENFDAVGRWRTAEGPNKIPIDPSGVLPDGTKIGGAADLRKVLASKSDQFVMTLTEKLLVYALGRELEHHDAPVVRKILRDTGPDHRWSAVILSIVNSTPFQMRRSRES